MYSILARLIAAKLERRYGKVLHRGEPAGRKLGHRRGLGDPFAAGRLHAHGRYQLDHGHQRHAAQEPAL